MQLSYRPNIYYIYKSSENDNYAEVNVREKKHCPKPRPPADTTVVYSDHIMKGQPPPPPYEPVELKQLSNLQASATVIPAGVKVDDSEFDEDTIELRAPHMNIYQKLLRIYYVEMLCLCNHVILKLACLISDLISI